MNAIEFTRTTVFEVKSIIKNIVKTENEFINLLEYNSIIASAKNQIDLYIESQIAQLKSYDFIESKTGKHHTKGIETPYSYILYHGLNLLKWYK